MPGGGDVTGCGARQGGRGKASAAASVALSLPCRLRPPSLRLLTPWPWPLSPNPWTSPFCLDVASPLLRPQLPWLTDFPFPCHVSTPTPRQVRYLERYHHKAAATAGRATVLRVDADGVAAPGADGAGGGARGSRYQCGPFSLEVCLLGEGGVAGWREWAGVWGGRGCGLSRGWLGGGWEEGCGGEGGCGGVTRGGGWVRPMCGYGGWPQVGGGGAAESGSGTGSSGGAGPGGAVRFGGAGAGGIRSRGGRKGAATAALACFGDGWGAPRAADGMHTDSPVSGVPVEGASSAGLRQS
jgi:hypothetical protein